MGYATIKDGKFTGVVYSELTDSIKDYHIKNGLSFVKIDRNTLSILNQDEVINSNGVIEADYGSPTDGELKNQKIMDYKELYLGVVNAKLKDLDYDSLATVDLWKDDAVFGAEATNILDWYKSIISINYSILDSINNGLKYNDSWADILPTKDEYIAELPEYVGV